MKLIVGLGNPGEKYKNNRHNVGFMFVDYFLLTYNSQLVTQKDHIFLKKNKYMNSEIAIFKKKFQVTSYELQDIVLAKPLTFMNLSGKAVKNVLADYRLPITDLLVVHDDLDIPLGKFKIQKGVGPKLHNGIESIEKALGRKDFWRIRIGVDNRAPQNWVNGETYVLNDFLSSEKDILLKRVFPKIFKKLWYIFETAVSKTHLLII